MLLPCLWAQIRPPPTATRVPRMLRSGKYRGFSYKHVKDLDRPYCGWGLDANVEATLPRDMRVFACHIEREHGGLLRLGRHKGMWFQDVWKAHPDYCEWAAELQDPGDAMKSFSEFSKKRVVADQASQEEPPSKTSKKSRKDECKSEGEAYMDKNAKACVVCMTSEAEAAFVPCVGPSHCHYSGGGRERLRHSRNPPFHLYRN